MVYVYNTSKITCLSLCLGICSVHIFQYFISRSKYCWLFVTLYVIVYLQHRLCIFACSYWCFLFHNPGGVWETVFRRFRPGHIPSNVFFLPDVESRRLHISTPENSIDGGGWQYFHLKHRQSFNINIRAFQWCRTLDNIVIWVCCGRNTSSNSVL